MDTVWTERKGKTCKNIDNNLRMMGKSWGETRRAAGNGTGFK